MKLMVSIATLAFLASAAFAQASPAADVLNAGAKPSVLDGSVTKGEYAFAKTLGTTTISASLGEDGLVYIAIEAPTNGWVALGFGSLKMDKAKIMMAYDNEGKPMFVEQVGAGYTHKDAKKNLVKSWSVKTLKDITTLEMSIPKTNIITGSKLDLIWAYGAKKDFSSYHQKKGAFSIQIK